MTSKTKQMIENIPRLKDFYEVGPVQRAAVEDLVEAIVRECAEVATDKVMNVATYENALYVSTHIKKHFGIEG